MKLVFRNLLAVIFLVTAINLNAQNLEQHIPNDARVVMKIDPQRISAKVDFAALKKADFYQTMMEGMAGEMGKEASDVLTRALNNPAEFGMNLNVPYYMYVQSDKKSTNVNFLMQLSDKAEFSKLMKEQLGRNDMVSYDDKGDYQGYFMENAAISWSGNVAQIAGGVMERDTSGNTTDEAYQQASMAYLQGAVAEGFKHKTTKSIKSHSNYKLATTNKYDISVWMDYGFVNSMSSSSSAESLDMMGMGAFADNLSALNKDSYMLIGADFDNGKLDMDSKMYMNPEMAEMYRNSSNEGINKKFAKFIPRHDLMGYMSMGMNIDGLVKSLKKLFDPKNESIPFMEGMAVASLQGMGINMTASEIYKLFPGDAVIAITGMKKFKGMITQTEYDENFNTIEKQVEGEEELPLMTMMMSYSNDDHLKQILNLAQGMLGFAEEDGLLSMAVPGSPMKLFLAHENGIFFATNDEDFVKKKRKKGYSRCKRMSKNHCKLMTGNAFTMFWDVPETLDGMPDMAMPGMEGFIRSTKETFDNMTITMGKISGNVLDSNLSVNFVDKKKNALTQFFNYINEMYLTQGQSL